MKELLNYIVCSIVDNPSDVQIHQLDGKKTSLYEIEINKNDVGKIIGKNGQTLEAISTVLSVASVRKNRKSVLEIID